MTALKLAARIVTTIGAIVTLTSCGGGDSTAPVTPPPPVPVTPTAGLKIVIGAGVSDTIEAQPAQALIVEVRKADGSLSRGTVVRFEVQGSLDSLRRGEPTMAACVVTAPQCGSQFGYAFATDSTDADGRARVLVRLGRVAGRGVIRVRVPDFGFEDSATYTVKPGLPAIVRTGVMSLGLDIGASSTLRGIVSDRAGNTRTEATALSAGPGTSLTVDATTNTLTGKDLGTQWAYVKFGALSDSVNVRVVPTGRLVVWSPGLYSIKFVNVNGLGVAKVMATGVSSDFGTFPRFDATRSRLTWHNGQSNYGGPSNVVVSLDTATGARRELLSGTVFSTVLLTRLQQDGTLLVIGRRSVDAPSAPMSLWKVAADNTVTLGVALPDLGAAYGGADVSPDGSRVAYLGTTASFTQELRIVNVSTGTVNILDASARSPRFSPQGDRVAYLIPPQSGYFGSLDGAPAVINADGTGKKPLGGGVMSPGLSWSPDAAYLVGRNSDYGLGSGLRLLRVSDGISVLLALGDDYYQPDWR